VSDQATQAWRQRLAARFDDDAGYRRDPAGWVRARAQEEPWSIQREIMASVVEHRATAVPACHGPGKSWSASRIMGWWIDEHPRGTAFVVSTAPTAAQVSAILWRELTRLHGKAKLPGRINRAGYPQWYIGTGIPRKRRPGVEHEEVDAELVGYGRKPSDYTDSAFTGIHADNILIVIDEAGGISKALFDQAETLMTNASARILAIGNPDDSASHFATVCKPGSGWNVIPIDALRTPNMTEALVIGDDPERPAYPLTAALMRTEHVPFAKEIVSPTVRQRLTYPVWVEERVHRWAGVPLDAANLPQDELDEMVRRRCAANPMFTAKVRGRFPDAGTTGVIPLGWVTAAVYRWHDWDEAGRPQLPLMAGRRVVGIDVARGGDDETVIAERRGQVITELTRSSVADVVETADQMAAWCHEAQSLAVVDVIGIGAGVFDTLRRYKREGLIVAQPIAFNAAASSTRISRVGNFRFRNDRAAAWWRLREALDPSRGSTLCIPDDEELLQELTTVQYRYLVGGIIQIESKDDVKKRIGRSTNAADAVIQSFWTPGEVIDEDGDSAIEWRDTTKAERAVAGVVDWEGYDRFREADVMGSGLGLQGRRWNSADVLPDPRH